MTATAQRRRRVTILGFVGTLLLLVAAGALFIVGVITLSNSEEGEAVGVETRPVSVLPATPNAMLAVVDDAGALDSVVVMTLMPDGVGGSIATIPANADATAAFGVQRRALNELFRADDIEGFTSAVEEMLSITIERTQVVTADELADLLVDVPSIEVQVPPADGFWDEVAAATPISRDPPPVPVDEAGQPVPPATVGELVERLLAGEAQTRPLATRPATKAENPTGVDVVIVDRRDAALVFAQVSPALVSTPNLALSLRIVAPFSDEQIAAGGGRYVSTSELVLDVIGEMLFFQANIVSADTQPAPGGAATVTRIEVAEERFIEDMQALAAVVFGESEVVPAPTLIEGVDAVVTLGTDYITKKGPVPSVATSIAPDDTSAPVGGTVAPND